MEVAAFNLLIHVLRPTKVIILVHIKYNFIYQWSPMKLKQLQHYRNNNFEICVLFLILSLDPGWQAQK